MRNCSEHCAGSNGLNVEQGELVASLGHRGSGDTKFEHMRLKKRARAKRSARELKRKSIRGKGRKCFK